MTISVDYLTWLRKQDKRQDNTGEVARFINSKVEWYGCKDGTELDFLFKNLYYHGFYDDMYKWFFDTGKEYTDSLKQAETNFYCPEHGVFVIIGCIKL